MASSLPTHARKEATRTECMLELPPLCAIIASTNPCNEDGSPRDSNHTSSDKACSTELNPPREFLPEPPQLDRSKCQPSFRQARFGASPVSVSVTSGRVSVQDVNDSILEEVPTALVTHVHDSTMPEASTMISISSSHDFAKAFRKSSPSFILVHNCEQSANLTIQMLQNQAGQSDGAVIVVLVEQGAKADFHPIVKKVPDFVHSGADDVVVIPFGASNINFTIAASLAKAKAIRDQTMHFQKHIRASMKQCQELFWRDAHHYIPGFPKFEPQLHEVCERHVGNMVFVRRLGKGSFGSVYKCVDEMRNTCSAVKVFAKERISSTGDAMQIATEIALLQRLEHENVIKFLGVAQGMQCVYLFMELAGTMNLFHMMHREAAKGLPWSRAGALFSQIVAGVAHCHKMQVAHCDLKPENIVVSKFGCAKIVDFGQAVDLSKDVAPLQGPLGTMPFTAPEIMCPCLHWDPPAADVWSLGMILVEMLCGIDAFVDLLGWRSLGRELRNPLRLAQRANEVKEFFAKDETHTHGEAIMAISCLCHDVPPPPLMELLGNMLKFMPEERVLAKSAAERIEDINLGFTKRL